MWTVKLFFKTEKATSKMSDQTLELEMLEEPAPVLFSSFLKVI